MCQKCNYHELLSRAKLNVTDNRIHVLEVIGANNFPVSASDIYTTLERNSSINRVTVYRILDLLVDHGLVERISTAGRSFYYELAPNANHQSHPHFYCKECSQMFSLSPEIIEFNMDRLWKTFPGQIDKIEVRIDGICKSCVKAAGD